MADIASDTSYVASDVTDGASDMSFAASVTSYEASVVTGVASVMSYGPSDVSDVASVTTGIAAVASDVPSVRFFALCGLRGGSGKDLETKKGGVRLARPRYG